VSPADGPPSLWTRIAPRASRTQAIVGAMFMLLGFLGVLVVRGTDDPGILQTARPEDLVRVLEDLTARQERLDAELLRLQVAEAALQQGSPAQALAEARRRAEGLEVLAGTTEVTGPGVTLTIEGTEVTSAVLLAAVQELRDAGAEAIQIGEVRVVASTWFADVEGQAVVDGVPVTAPTTIVAIGDPGTMATALQIPGGVASTVRADGGSLAIEESSEVRILPRSAAAD
jgi:uncharacterized protein YlxW (UPF0749 family)